MTEAEWMACQNPQEMLDFLRGKVSDRKLWLVACGYCRSIWHLLHDPRSQRAVEAAERAAEGHITRAELEQISEAAIQAWREHFDVGSAAASQTSFVRGLDHRTWLEWIASNTANTVESNGRRNGRAPQVYLLRDIFGNPFRPVAIDPAWKMPAVVQLARSLYEERRFEDMPVLADALEEAGCQDAAVLGHCRGPGPHIRGCWVLDLLMGRE